MHSHFITELNEFCNFGFGGRAGRQVITAVPKNFVLDRFFFETLTGVMSKVSEAGIRPVSLGRSDTLRMMASLPAQRAQLSPLRGLTVSSLLASRSSNRS